MLYILPPTTHQLIFQTPICSNTSVLKHSYLFLHTPSPLPCLSYFPSFSSLFPPPSASLPPLPPSVLSPLVQIKLRCQLQKWNEPAFIFLVLHKHKHVLICVAVLTDLPVRARWYRLPPSAGLKAVREWGGLLSVWVWMWLNCYSNYSSLVEWIHNSP